MVSPVLYLAMSVTHEIFPGTSIAIYGTVDGTTGVTQPFSQWQFSLDGSPAGTFVPSDTQTTRQVLLHQSSSLSDSSHTITITRQGGATPNLWLDYFEYNITAKTNLQGSTLFFDNTDPRIDYSGSWSPVPPSNMTGIAAAFGNTAATTGASDGSFTFNFDGVIVSLPVELSLISTIPRNLRIAIWPSAQYRHTLRHHHHLSDHQHRRRSIQEHHHSTEWIGWSVRQRSSVLSGLSPFPIQSYDIRGGAVRNNIHTRLHPGIPGSKSSDASG
jgi:hypothetical protein